MYYVRYRLLNDKFGILKISLSLCSAAPFCLARSLSTVIFSLHLLVIYIEKISTF